MRSRVWARLGASFKLCRRPHVKELRVALASNFGRRISSDFRRIGLVTSALAHNDSTNFRADVRAETAFGVGCVSSILLPVR